MKRVLMVDDNGAVLFAFRKLCAASGILAETADSLNSALGLLSRERFDVVISDLNPTGPFGDEAFEVVCAAKRYNPLVRAFIWTAYDEQRLRDKFLRIGIEGYLIKPVAYATLLSIINAYPANCASANDRAPVSPTRVIGETERESSVTTGAAHGPFSPWT